jgi:hypothetical protein
MKDEMGTCRRKGAYRILLRNVREREHRCVLVAEGKINVKMDLKDIGWEGAVWIDLAWDRDRW